MCIQKLYVRVYTHTVRARTYMYSELLCCHRHIRFDALQSLPKMQLGQFVGSDLALCLHLRIDHACKIRTGFDLSQKVYLIVGSDPDQMLVYTCC